MILHWNENPLKTIIELDNRDKRMILKSLQAEKYLEILSNLDFTLDRKIKKNDLPLTLEQVHQKIKNWGPICNMKVTDEEVEWVIQSLKSEHAGDCTCIPCSCEKCIAEEYLGIDTISGLGKHEAAKIQGAFKLGKTIDNAISILSEEKEYIKPDTWPDKVGWECHVPRWKKERESAVKWLTDYKQKHGF